MPEETIALWRRDYNEMIYGKDASCDRLENALGVSHFPDLK
jgi:hypothetical protein